MQSAAVTATLSAGVRTRKITRDELAGIVAPPPTATHKPVAHIEIVNSLIESLGFRHLEVVGDEYAVSPDGMKMFGIMELSTEAEDFRFAIGLRNSNDKSMRLALTVGLKVFVCDNMAFKGDFQPVLAKHSKSFSLRQMITLGVDEIQRGFAPLRDQVARWQRWQIDDERAKVAIYEAFVERKLAPRQLLSDVHRAYFDPEFDVFKARTVWSLHNAFTHAFKRLQPVRQFQSTAALGHYFQRWG
jgi:hypothetical protein